MDDKFKRRENEKIDEYQFRLSMMKLVDNEDIDWEEIRELLESKEHRDTIRRKGKGMQIAKSIYEDKIKDIQEKYIYEIREIKNNVNEEIDCKKIREINKKLEIFEKEKIKLRDQKNDLNSIRRDIARIDSLIECSKESIEKLNESKPLMGDIVIESSNKDTVGICMISDIHIGVEVDNILGKYNPNICKLKMKYFINKVIEYGIMNNISELYVLGLGDYITGIIHTTNRLESRLLITEQVTVVSELLSESINELSKHFICKVGLIQGNHDEIRIKSKDDTLIKETFTTFINEFVKIRLENNDNVEFLYNDDDDIEHIRFNIKGFNFFASHGNRDRDKSLDRTIEMFDDNIDFILRGHYHSASTFFKNNTTIVTNGSFSCENYSKNARLYSQSIQKLLIIDNYGLMSDYNINLDLYNVK